MKTAVVIKKEDCSTFANFSKKKDKYLVAIIGCGPKGLYGLERLLANLKHTPPAKQVDIHVFNRNANFGAGDIYRTDQPLYLLMNYNNKFINAWSTRAPASVTHRSYSFLEWLKKYPQKNCPTDPEGYAPRAVVGKYLSWVLRSLIHHCPQNVAVHLHAYPIDAIEERVSKFYLSATSQEIDDLPFDQVLIATGHQRPFSGPALPGWKEVPASTKTAFVPFVYPVEQQLSIIPPGAKVAVKGIGLTFIDAALALSIGRGGRFVETSDKELVYQPGGQEPAKIFPFSRSGNLMFPRRGEKKRNKSRRLFFNAQMIASLTRDKSRQLDFEKQLLPLIDAEIKSDYYRYLFKQMGWCLEERGDIKDLEKQIDDFHQSNPDISKFSLYSLMDMLPMDSEPKQETYLKHLEKIIEAAEEGRFKNPLAAATATWRDLSALFNEVYSFGGLNPASQQLFDQRYAGVFNRIAYGPPLVNTRKMLALARAGIIDFSYAIAPTVSWESDGKEQYTFILSKKPHQVRVSHLIDARIPKNNILEAKNGLYAAMLENGLIKPYTNQSKAGNFYKPGCVDLDRNAHPINDLGEISRRITFTGTPTEGVTYDNDTLSRERNDFVSAWAQQITNQIQAAK